MDHRVIDLQNDAQTRFASIPFLNRTYQTLQDMELLRFDTDLKMKEVYCWLSQIFTDSIEPFYNWIMRQFYKNPHYRSLDIYNEFFLLKTTGQSSVIIQELIPEFLDKDILKSVTEIIWDTNLIGQMDSFHPLLTEQYWSQEENILTTSKVPGTTFWRNLKKKAHNYSIDYRQSREALKRQRQEYLLLKKREVQIFDLNC